MTMVRGVKLALAASVVVVVGGLLLTVLALSSIEDPSRADVIADCLRQSSGQVTDLRTQAQVALLDIVVTSDAGTLNPDAVARARAVSAELERVTNEYQEAVARSHANPSAYAAECRKGVVP